MGCSMSQTVAACRTIMYCGNYWWFRSPKAPYCTKKLSTKLQPTPCKPAFSFCLCFHLSDLWSLSQPHALQGIELLLLFNSSFIGKGLFLPFEKECAEQDLTGMCFVKSKPVVHGKINLAWGRSSDFFWDLLRNLSYESTYWMIKEYFQSPPTKQVQRLTQYKIHV